MKKEDIQTKIDVIFDGLDKLKFFKAMTYEEFISEMSIKADPTDNSISPYQRIFL